MSLRYEIVTVTNFSQNCSIIWCDKTQQAAIVDPGGDADKIIAKVAELGVTVSKILLTHAHLDHVGAAPALAEHFNVEILGPEKQDAFWLQALPAQSEMFGFVPMEPFDPDQWLSEGDNIPLGQESLSVLHIPGHTPGHIVFFHQASNTLWVGDVLFSGSIGRTDFPKGDHAALIHGIKTKLLPLGDKVTFIPGHGPVSSLGHERMTNMYIADEKPLF